MIIYWKTLEKDASDNMTIPSYMTSDYFAGIGRIKAQTDYPSSPPYGTVRYKTDEKIFVGFKEDTGWQSLG